MNLTPTELSLAVRMNDLAVAFRGCHSLTVPPASSGVYPLSTAVGGRPQTKHLVWYPSIGCTYSLRGGCTFCNFGSSDDFSLEGSLLDFEMLMNSLDPGTRRIHIAPGGSFYSDQEAPPRLRDGVLATLERFPFLHAVGVESRPSFVTEEKLLETLDKLPDSVHSLTIGFGFECLDDLVRRVSVNKGYDVEHVLKAVEAIRTVNLLQDRVRIEFEIYVMLKPLFLTEREAIDEAIRTIKWSYQIGAETAVLFTNTVKKNTLQAWFQELPCDIAEPVRFAPPYLRSAVQVLLELDPIDRARTAVLGVQSGIMADHMPRGCDLCYPYILGALQAHNFVRDVGVLREAAASHCECHADWRESLGPVAEDLSTRIARALALGEAEPWISTSKSVAIGPKP